MPKKNMNKDETNSESAEGVLPECFAIMPISDPTGYNKGHFREVYEGLISPACIGNYTPHLADLSSKTEMIHLDMLQRLLHAEVAVCDLSSLNPNVMYELGLRQAFEKPVILIIDDDTKSPFDVGGIRTITYPKDLRYNKILSIQGELNKAICETVEAHMNDDTGNSLVDLLSLPPKRLRKLDENESKIVRDEYIINSLATLSATVDRLGQEIRTPNSFTNLGLSGLNSGNLNTINGLLGASNPNITSLGSDRKTNAFASLTIPKTDKP